MAFKILHLAVLSMLIVFASASASAKAYGGYVEPEDSNQDFDFGFEEQAVRPVASPFGDLTNIILLVKNQVKDILIEIGMQILRYACEVFKQFKIRMLKKLGLYTLSDIFHAIFDGVTDFVVDSAADVPYEGVRLTPAIRSTKPSTANELNHLMNFFTK